MVKRLFLAGMIFAVGFLAGGLAFYLFGPLLYDRAISETPPDELQTTILTSGQFRDADAAHRGSGTAELLQTAGGAHIVRLSNFRVTNGPDLEVWLVRSRAIMRSEEVLGSDYVSLGPLKGNVGDQTYAVPDGTDPAMFGSVVIWCRAFSVLFATADMTRP